MKQWASIFITSCLRFQILQFGAYFQMQFRCNQIIKKFLISNVLFRVKFYVKVFFTVDFDLNYDISSIPDFTIWYIFSNAIQLQQK